MWQRRIKKEKSLTRLWSCQRFFPHSRQTYFDASFKKVPTFFEKKNLSFRERKIGKETLLKHSYSYYFSSFFHFL